MKNIFLTLYLYLLFTGIILAQSSYRPDLFFREDWKETPAEIPVNQNHVQNENLTVHLYGPGKDVIKKSNHEKPVDDPFYIWSGLCEGNWMLSLKHRQQNVDLTGFAKVKMRTKQVGLRELRIALKLADGKWLVSDQSAGASKDWRILEFNIQDINWHHLDPEGIVAIGPATDPDLSNVEEIGFTDLMPGGQSKACSRLDWIEVHGKPVAR